MYKEGSACDKFAESLQNKKDHKPGSIAITREQVEKMRGAWIEVSDADGCTWSKCSDCGEDLDSLEDAYDFCPYCGDPMTDKAVDTLWKRLEAMRDGAKPIDALAPILALQNERVSRVREIEELYTELHAVTGFTAEQLLGMFAEGYTLKKPDRSKHFETMANLAERIQREPAREGYPDCGANNIVKTEIKEDE